MAKIHHRTYDKHCAHYERIDDALDGQDAVQSNTNIYLRNMPGMSRREFESYSKGGSYYPVAERTLRGMTGLALRNAPQIELPDRLEGMRLSATYRGHSLSVFIENVLREIMSKGRYVALLDFPTDGNNILSLPYLSTFNAKSILDWKYSLVGGKEQVTYLRLHEDNEDLADEGIQQHLVLSLELLHPDPVNDDMDFDNMRVGFIYKVRRFHVKGSDEVMVHESIPTVNGKPLTEIPVVCFSPYNLTLDIEKPPFLDLVDISLKHYQNSCDLEHTVHLAAQPTFVRIGVQNVSQKTDQVGPGVVWDLPVGGDAKVLEISGEGARVTREAMTDKEQRMASLGARFITEGINRNEAADTARMRHRGENALLHSSVEMVEQGLTKLLRWAAEWMQPGTADLVVVKFHRDFVSMQADPQLVAQLLKAWTSGAISHETFFINMKKGELIPADRSFEDEKDMIEEDGGDLSLSIPRIEAA